MAVGTSRVGGLHDLTSTMILSYEKGKVQTMETNWRTNKRIVTGFINLSYARRWILNVHKNCAANFRLQAIEE